MDILDILHEETFKEYQFKNINTINLYKFITLGINKLSNLQVIQLQM